MPKEIVPNYSEAAVAVIQAAADANGGRINKDVASRLATQLDKNVKSVIAKAVRMGIYQAAAKQSVNGGAIERKEEIVAEIQQLVSFNVDGLEKAPKTVLTGLRDALSA